MPQQFILVACIGLVVTGCARPTEPHRISRSDILLSLDVQRTEALVPRNATLDGLLRHHNLPNALVHAAVESVRGVFDPRQLRADRPYRLVQSLDGLLREFEYEIDGDRLLRIVSVDPSQPAALEAEVLPIEKDVSVTAVRGDIDASRSSLIAAMDEAGETLQLALTLADIFGGQVDFQSDLQQGDQFEVLFERATRVTGEFAGYGDILGATLVANGREYRAFRWVNPDTGKAGYYDENGHSLKRMFLRSPLKLEAPRVTSGFSRARLHPVHRTVRPHLGVDYGVPHGSPVVAVADGTVVSTGWAGGGGNQVRLRHAGSIETYYLHLSKFASGVRTGTRVSQGQVIGYVGSTGTATGPHLDYRFRRNGVFVNPLTAHGQQPSGEPIQATQLADFRHQRDGFLAQISETLLAQAPRHQPDTVTAVQ
ncbi:M23 family metallopeptidase [soil metagenome]|nr:peptidoglycan DD-metalloendopeptidase family protein [Acidobacteriota bacterium]